MLEEPGAMDTVQSQESLAVGPDAFRRAESVLLCAAPEPARCADLIGRSYVYDGKGVNDLPATHNHVQILANAR